MSTTSPSAPKRLTKYRSISALGDNTPWLTLGFLFLLVALFFGYHFAKVPPVRDEPLTFEGKTLTGLDTIDKMRIPPDSKSIYIRRAADQKIEDVLNQERNAFIILEGPKGSGKTLAVREAARRLDRPYIRVAVGPAETAQELFARLGVTLASGVEAAQAFVEKTLAEHAIRAKGARAIVHFEVCDLDDGQRHAEIVQVAKWLMETAAVVVDAPPDALSPLYEKEHGRYDTVAFDEFTPVEAAAYCTAVGADPSPIEAHLRRNGYLPVTVALLAGPRGMDATARATRLEEVAREDLLASAGIIRRALGTPESRKVLRDVAAQAYNATTKLQKVLPDETLQADFAEHRPRRNDIAHLKRLLRVVTDDVGNYHVTFKTRAAHTMARRILGVTGGLHDANNASDAATA